MSINSITKSTASLSVLLSILMTSIMTALSTPPSEAITVRRNHRGKVCIYVPKSYVLRNNHVDLEVRWGAHTMRGYLSAAQLGENSTSWGWNAGFSRGGGNGGADGSSNDRFPVGRNPNFGVELHAHGDNVPDIHTNFPVVGFEHQGCKSDYNLTIY